MDSSEQTILSQNTSVSAIKIPNIPDLIDDAIKAHNGDGIGYNVGKINALLETLVSSYTIIGRTIGNEWTEVSGILRKNWVGPDEIAYEKDLAGSIKRLFDTCGEAIRMTQRNVITAGENWKKFQMKNTSNFSDGSLISGNTTFQTGINHIAGAKDALSGYASLNGLNIVEARLPRFDIDSLLKINDITFNINMNMGLQSKLSGTAILNSVQSYAKSIYNQVRVIYDEIDTKSAFIGEEQSVAMSSYLKNMGEDIANLNRCLKNLHDIVGQLTEAYTRQEQETAKSATAAQSGIQYDQANILQ
jgi:hypothetical protein